MDSPHNQADVDNTDLWPELEAVLRDLEDRVASEDVEEMVGDPTAPWEGIADQAVVTVSGAVLKALCDIAAQAAGAMEWEADRILIHSGMSAPVPLRFQVRPPLP
jgi:hypothetical protein